MGTEAPTKHYSTLIHSRTTLILPAVRAATPIVRSRVSSAATTKFVPAVSVNTASSVRLATAPLVASRKASTSAVEAPTITVADPADVQAVSTKTTPLRTNVL